MPWNITAVFHQRFAVIGQVDEHVRHAGAVERLDDLAQDMVDVEDGVVVRVVELLERALVRHVGVIAHWLELLELGRMPVAVGRAVASAAQMQDDEAVAGNIGARGCPPATG